MDEVLAYLDSLPEPQRSNLHKLRADLLALLPEATEGISYAMPAILYKGKPIAGYFAYKNHLGYYPHSSKTVGLLETELENFKKSKAGFQFAHDQVLPKAILRKLLDLRIEELRQRYPTLFT